jgi:hypothetical protein
MRQNLSAWYAILRPANFCIGKTICCLRRKVIARICKLIVVVITTSQLTKAIILEEIGIVVAGRGFFLLGIAVSCSLLLRPVLLIDFTFGQLGHRLQFAARATPHTKNCLGLEE